MKGTPKFRYARAGGVVSSPAYTVTRVEDGFVLGQVWKNRAGWANRYEEPFPSREAAARSLSIESLKETPLQTKSRVWVSVVHEGVGISMIVEVLDVEIEKLELGPDFVGSCAITFEGRGIIAGHLRKVPS